MTDLRNILKESENNLITIKNLMRSEPIQAPITATRLSMPAMPNSGPYYKKDTDEVNMKASSRHSDSSKTTNVPTAGGGTAWAIASIEDRLNAQSQTLESLRRAIGNIQLESEQNRQMIKRVADEVSLLRTCVDTCLEQPGGQPRQVQELIMAQSQQLKYLHIELENVKDQTDRLHRKTAATEKGIDYLMANAMKAKNRPRQYETDPHIRADTDIFCNGDYPRSHHQLNEMAELKSTIRTLNGKLNELESHQSRQQYKENRGEYKGKSTYYDISPTLSDIDFSEIDLSSELDDMSLTMTEAHPAQQHILKSRSNSIVSSMKLDDLTP